MDGHHQPLITAALLIRRRWAARFPCGLSSSSSSKSAGKKPESGTSSGGGGSINPSSTGSSSSSSTPSEAQAFSRQRVAALPCHKERLKLSAYSDTYRAPKELCAKVGDGLMG